MDHPIVKVALIVLASLFLLVVAAISFSLAKQLAIEILADKKAKKAAKTAAQVR